MRITYERTGGFTGMRVAMTIDLKDLPDDQAKELGDLLDQSDFFDLPEKIMPSGSVPDQFQYTVTVEAERGSHTVRTGDVTAPDSLRPLLERLNQLSRIRRR